MSLLAILLLPWFVASDPAPLPPAEPAPVWSTRFQRTQGWIGGDGAYSVAVTPQRTLWLFSDTWVGSIQEGKRTNATIVNNTVAVQTGHGDQAKVEFVVAQGKDGKPAALLTPTDGRGWFWLFDGACVDGKLYLFLAQIEKTSDPGVFGFRQVGMWLGIVANPLDHPTAWHVTQQKLPCAEFLPQHSRSFGTAVLAVGEHLYIYGVDEAKNGTGSHKHLLAARVPLGSVADFSTWRYYRDGDWVADFRAASRLFDGMASESSVSYLPARKQYLIVYSETALSPRILARTAPAPMGPWSKPQVLYRCPEAARDKNIFCYAAKAHPAISAPGELLITYATNSLDFWQVARDARLYWPHFVRVKLAP